MTSPAIDIERIGERSSDAGVIAAIEAIFFEASNTQSFPSTAAREAFREKWLGLYLREFTDTFLLARSGDDIVGYLAGAITDAPADSRLASHRYYKFFRDAAARFPAHLHLNIRTDHRSRGIGALLVAAFLEICHDRNIPGVHIVTSDGARNMAFYCRLGFTVRARSATKGPDIVLMGREVGHLL